MLWCGMLRKLRWETLELEKMKNRTFSMVFDRLKSFIAWISEILTFLFAAGLFCRTCKSQTGTWSKQTELFPLCKGYYTGSNGRTMQVFSRSVDTGWKYVSSKRNTSQYLSATEIVGLWCKFQYFLATLALKQKKWLLQSVLVDVRLSTNFCSSILIYCSRIYNKRQ